MTRSLPLLRACLALLACSFSLTPARADEPRSLVLDARTANVDAEALRAALESELSVPIELGEPTPPALVVTMAGEGRATVTYVDVSLATATRELDLSGSPDESVEMLALIAANLVRNEADALLASFARRAPPPKPDTPEPPPPAPAPAKAPEPNPCDYPATVWFAADFAPGVGASSTERGRRAVRRFSLNGPGGLSRGLHGLELALGVSIKSGFMCGAQLAAGMNLVLGPAQGLQLAPLNVVYGSLRGAQLGVANGSRDTRGAQLGVINAARDARGLQLGVINVARDARGLQLGVINVARRSRASFGLFNLVYRGYTSLDAWVTENGMLFTGITHGSDLLHHIYAVGTRVGPAGQSFMYALGFGARLYHGSRVRIDLDALAHNLRATDDGLNIIGTLRLPVTVALYERLGVFVAPSYNALITRDLDERTQAPFGEKVVNDGTKPRVEAWPGLSVGLRMRLSGVERGM